MRILVTNDDGYNARAVKILAKMMLKYGEVTVIGPKYHQSGMSMAVSMGLKPIAVKDLGYDEDGIHWMYADGTPASCVKFGIDNVFTDCAPDVVVSGINYGSNAGSAVLYSGTIGAAKEASLAGIPAIGVSLNDMLFTADFSAVEELFPPIFEKLLEAAKTAAFGTFYNVNFPKCPKDQIKGIRVAVQGINHWEREFAPYDMGIFPKLGIKPIDMGIVAFPPVEEGEKVYMMVGDMVDDSNSPERSDQILMNDCYIAIAAEKIDSTDYQEFEKLVGLGFDKDFK